MKSAALLCALLAACGGGEAGSGEVKPPVAPAAAPAQPPAAPAAAAVAPAVAPASTQLADLGYYGEGEVPPGPPPARCQDASDGHELVGTEPSGWHLAGWANTADRDLSLAGLRGRVVVVRFWTTGCPHCEKTLPALQRLSEELRDLPVTIVGAFHAKPSSSAPDLTRPLEVTRRWGITYPLAIDREWRTLRAWWLDGACRNASSVTFVVGKDGRVVHVHPGPRFHPSDDPDEADENRDYLALRAAVIAAAK